MRQIYLFVIQFYGLGIRIASLFNKKAKKWVLGRKFLFSRLEKLPIKDEKIAWFHAASLGEFEQGRPVIEAFRKHYADYKILLTFFSPSGYEIRKDYNEADYVCYLPLDTAKNAKKFIEIVNPQIVFFIKYEFWYNYLDELNRKNVPFYIFSTIFRPNQIFFKLYGKWFLDHLKLFGKIFVQNEESYELLIQKSVENVVIAGDTRFDRVAKIATKAKEFPLIEKFKENLPLVLLGSSWQEEEKLIREYMNSSDKKVQYIIAPHDVSENHIKTIQNLFNEKVLLYSDATEDNIKTANILIIDCVGILSGLYRYADIAFIGGGFGKGIHNILEALTFGVPVLFGTNYQKFQEAKDVLANGGGKSIQNFAELKNELDNLLDNSSKLQTAKLICKEYISEKQGATNIIMNHLTQHE